MRILKKRIYIVLSLSFFSNILSNNVLAEKIPFNPYFASIKSDKVNVRIGPNIRYPIEWIFVKKNEPVEVIGSFEQWRKIRDISGDEGWINLNMLSSKRFVIIKGTKNISLYKNTDLSNKIAELSPEIRASLISCNRELCNVEIKKIKGWIQRNNIWGIYSDEGIIK